MTSPQDFSAQFSVQDRNRAAGALIRTAGGFSLAAPCPSPPAPQPDIRVPPFVGSGVGQKACGCSGMIVVRQGAAWALAGSGMLIGPDAFLTVRHVAAGLSALQDPGGLSGHVPGAAVRLVLGPAAPGAHWVTPFTLPPGAGVSLTGASVRADAKGTVAVIRLPIPLPGAQGWALSDVGELGLFTDVIAIGTPRRCIGAPEIPGR